jgi:predicted nuclease with TOPRIM domain
MNIEPDGNPDYNESSIEALDKLEEQVTFLIRDRNRLKKENTELKTNLNDKENKLNAVTKDFSQLQNQTDELEKQLLNIRTRIEQLIMKIGSDDFGKSVATGSDD